MMTASGCISKLYLEIAQQEQRISRVVLCLDDSKWIELTDIVTEDGFTLPAPLGCQCIVTDISDRHWSHANYEIEFASSYSRDGVFWARGCREVDGIEGVKTRDA